MYFWCTIIFTAKTKKRENDNDAIRAIQMLADEVEVSKKVAKVMMDCLAQTAIAQVKKNGVFVLPGIGRLVRVDRKARMGRNPATGAAIKIPAKKAVKSS